MDDLDYDDLKKASHSLREYDTDHVSLEEFLNIITNPMPTKPKSNINE